MKHYVLGFAFDSDHRLALIKKKRPAWQLNRWNGIGGHVEDHETPRQAMAREFAEETGILIETPSWRKVAIMAGRPATEDEWMCSVYTVQDRRVAEVFTQTDEEVRLWSCVSFKRIALDCIENVPTLIEMCTMRKDHTNGLPLLRLEYP